MSGCMRYCDGGGSRRAEARLEEAVQALDRLAPAPFRAGDSGTISSAGMRHKSNTWVANQSMRSGRPAEPGSTHLRVQHVHWVPRRLQPFEQRLAVALAQRALPRGKGEAGKAGAHQRRHLAAALMRTRLIRFAGISCHLQVGWSATTTRPVPPSLKLQGRPSATTAPHHAHPSPTWDMTVAGSCTGSPTRYTCLAPPWARGTSVDGSTACR